MANEGGNRQRISRVTGRRRPSQKAGKPAKLNVGLEEGRIKPLKVPLDTRLKRAGNNLGQKALDGVNRASKTLGQPEEEALRKSQGIPTKTSPRYETAGGEALEPSGAETDTPTEQPGEESISREEDEGAEHEQPQGGAKAGQPAENEPEKKQDDDGGSGEETDSKKPNIENAVANKAVDWLKEKAKKIVSKELWTGVWAFIAANWEWILPLALFLIGGVLLWSFLMGTAGQSPSTTGQSTVQVYDPAKDRPTLQAVLAMSGDKDVQQLAAWETLAKLSDELTSIKNDAGLATRPDKDQIIGKIDNILSDVQVFSVSKDTKSGKKIIDGTKELWEMFGTLPSIADAGSPLPKGSVVGYTNNFHDGTPMNPCSKGSCPKGHRTFYQSERNTCDAVDLKAKNGTEIIAAFPGKVTRVGSDGRSHSVIYIQNTQGYLAVYAHIANPTVKLNDSVAVGQKLGTVYLGHLHFELAQNGKCVTSTPEDKINAKVSKKSVGLYLWQRMAKVLNNAV